MTAHRGSLAQYPPQGPRKHLAPVLNDYEKNRGDVTRLTGRHSSWVEHVVGLGFQNVVSTIYKGSAGAR